MYLYDESMNEDNRSVCYEVNQDEIHFGLAFSIFL